MISLCLIAKNEEYWLEDFLNHLKPVITEIVLCDTGSTDKTREIAKEFGARIFEIEWKDDFAAARNISLSYATQPWILTLDPDIRITQRDVFRFLDLTQDASAMAYEFIMRNYVRNQNLRDFQRCQGEFSHEERGLPGYFEDTRVALFRNTESIRFEGIVHETVLHSIGDRMKASDIILHHYGLLPEWVEAKNKRALYQKLSKRKANMDPQNWRAHLELGMELMASQDFNQARESFEKANELKANDPFILNRLLNAQSRSQKMDAAAKTASHLLLIEPENHDALLTSSAASIMAGRLDEAESTLRKLLKAHPQSEKGRMNLAILCSQLKRPKEAFLLLQEMSEKNWNDAAALKLTFEMALYSDHFKEAEKYIRRYLELIPNDLYATGHLTTALMYQGRLNESLETAVGIISQSPEHYLANFNAGVIYFERADWVSARKHLQSALDAKPADPFIMKALDQIQKEVGARA